MEFGVNSGYSFIGVKKGEEEEIGGEHINSLQKIALLSPKHSQENAWYQRRYQ